MALLIDDLQPLSPLATIEIPAALRGIEGAPPPQFEFDGSGTRLVIRSWVDMRYFPWLDDHRVDVGLFSGLVAIVLFVWITRRTIIRPRAVGHEHCRRCRYDITPLDGVRVSARCPECGCETTGRTVRGRRLRYWHFAIPLLCLSGTIACALIVSAGISSMPSPARTSWPIASLKERFPWWPLWRVENNIRSGYRGAVYSLDASGHIQGDPWIVPLSGRWHFSSDGSHIVALDFSQANGFVHQARILDCTARTTRTITFGTLADGFFQFASFAADGNSALVIHTMLDRSMRDGVTKIRRLDLETGALTDIASALIPSADGTAGSTSYSTPMMSACVGNSPLLPWALVAYNMEIPGPDALDANGPLLGSLLIVGTIDGEKRFDISRVLGVSWNNFACSIEGDSTVVINEKMSVDVRTGQCKARRYSSFEVKTTADPSVAQLTEYESREIPTPASGATAQKIARTESARALLDLRPNSRTNTSWFPLGGATGAFNERSGLCAIGFAEAEDKPPASFKVWRVKPK